MELKSRAWVNWLAALNACALALLSAGDATAVEPRVYQLENGGAIAPHLTVDLGQDSNPLRAERGSEASAYVRIRPEVTYIARRRNNELTLGYTGSYVQYLANYCADSISPGLVDGSGDCLSDASPEFDKASYRDHTLELKGFLEISRRARANFAIATELENQPLGTGLSAEESVGSTLEQTDSLVRNSAFLDYSYGASQARGEVRLGLNLVDRDYRENGVRSLAGLDERSVEPSVRLFYRIGTRTQVFAGVRQREISGGNAERTNIRQFIGVEFDASAITSGSIRLSSVNNDFDNPNRDDFKFSGVDVDLTWRPRRFSTVTINGGKETSRATLSEAVGITTRLNVNWKHFWRDRFSTIVGVGIERNDSGDVVESNDANDRGTSLRFRGLYNVRRWLDVGAFVQSEDREGTSVSGESRNFSRTVAGFTANATF